MSKSNIVIIGFMGTGKTMVAKRTAEILNMNFIDTDSLLEKYEEMTVAEIFAKLGEKYFRQRENDIAKEVANKKNMVIATGGGIVLNPDNMKSLSSTGIIIWLKAPIELIYKRIGSDENRPLAYERDFFELEEMYRKRYPLYEQYSDFYIDVSGKSIEEVSKEIEAYYKNIAF